MINLFVIKPIKDKKLCIRIRAATIFMSTRMGSHPLLIVDVKVYYRQRVWVHTLN